MKVWLTTSEAVTYTGKSELTLRSWRLKRIVQARKTRGSWEFEQRSLRRAKQQMEWNYEHRRIVPGPGRGRANVAGMIPLWEE